MSGGTLSRWFGSLNVIALKVKMRTAKSNRDWRKVLEHGADILARQPLDTEAPCEMAAAAQELELPNLAMWFLEQGRHLQPDNPDLIRAMAHLHEEHSELKRAILLWDKLRQLDPNDQEARHMIDELSVKVHLSKSQYRR